MGFEKKSLQPPNSSGEMPAEEAMLSLHYDIFDLSQNIVGTLMKPLFCESIELIISPVTIRDCQLSSRPRLIGA
jgi:hypothetical protein